MEIIGIGILFMVGVIIAPFVLTLALGIIAAIVSPFIKD